MPSFSKVITASLLCFSTTSCSLLGDIPAQFRIDRGVAPQHQDEDVRFRTTYYFRVFDVCDGEHVSTEDSETPDRIIPDKPFGPYRLRNDSLYRFRMTGKANAFFNKVHFESGTLRAEQIDPFGANVRYDEQAGSFKLISARQNRDELQIDATTREIKNLLNLRESLDKVADGQAELDNTIIEKIREINDPYQPRLYSLQIAAINSMNKALQLKGAADKAAMEVLSGYSPAPDPLITTKATDDSKLLGSNPVQKEMATKFFKLIQEVSNEAAKKIGATVDALKNRVHDLKKDVQKKDELERVQAHLDQALEYQKKAHNIAMQISEFESAVALKANTQSNAKQEESQSRCTNGQRARRGFQILGPEGIRTFDQDERLLMAFSYDAKPLISLLQELSSRKLSVRGGTTSFRELAKERVGLRDALYNLGKAKLELEREDPSDSSLSTKEIVKRIEERLSNSGNSIIPELDTSTGVRNH